MPQSVNQQQQEGDDAKRCQKKNPTARAVLKQPITTCGIPIRGRLRAFSVNSWLHLVRVPPSEEVIRIPSNRR